MAKRKHITNDIPTPTIPSPTLTGSKPELTVALQPGPSIEGGRIIMTPQCAYGPLCAQPALGGVIVTLVDHKSDGSDYRFQHRNYCCELHAAFDLLKEWNDAFGDVEAIVDMVRRSLEGEPMLGDRTSQSEIDAQVENILQGSIGGES